MKLAILALLVVAAAAFNPFADFENGHRAASKVLGILANRNKPALQADPSQACQAKMFEVYQGAILDTLPTCSAALAAKNFATACGGDCFNVLAQLYDVISSPACINDFPAEQITGMYAFTHLVCLKVDGQICMDQLVSFGSQVADFDPMTSELVANDTMMAMTVCSPCMTAVLNAMKVYRSGTEASDAMIMGFAGAINVICEKEDGHYCLTNVKAISLLIGAAEMTPLTSDQYVANWVAAANAICTKTCFAKVMNGFIALSDTDPLSTASSTQQFVAMARIKAMCARVPSENKFCVEKLASAWKTADMASQTCTNPFSIAGAKTAEFPYLTCGTVFCPAEKLNAYFAEIGCCGATLRDGVVKHYRDAIAALTTNCGITINATTCVPRKTAEFIGKYKFVNLKWTYVSANLADIKKRIAQDIATASQLDVADLTVTLTAITTASTDAHVMATETGVEATATADCNQDDCQRGQTSAVTFNKLGGLPSSAAIDPKKSTSETPSSAFTMTASALALVFAIVVALF